VRGYWFLVLLVGFAFLSTPSRAQQIYEPKDKDVVEEENKADKKWLSLGDTKLKPGKNKVKILVGWEQGRVDTFKIRVEERAVEIIEVEVHYAKGAKDVYELGKIFNAGSETGLFTFDRDKKRYLRKIYIRFRFPDLSGENRDSGNWKQPAIVEVVGRRKTS
jgi:hypothetical protein